MSGWVILVLILSADAYADTFQSANEAYLRGDYDTAIQRYTQLMREGVTSPEVVFNAGNAFFRNGRVGMAIACYEWVLWQDPRFPGTQENLQKAVSATERKLPPPSSSRFRELLYFWIRDWSPVRLRNAFAGTWLLLWALVFIRWLRRIPYQNVLIVILAILSVYLGVAWYLKLHPEPLAVTIAEKTTARYGPSDQDAARFDLLQGDRVLVQETRGDWCRIRTAEGDEGWVRAADILQVASLPSYNDTVTPTTQAPPGQQAKNSTPAGFYI